MNDTPVPPPAVTLRVPGRWASLDAFEAALPEGVWCDEESLHLPDGSVFELRAAEPDDDFADVFRGSCTRELLPEDDEGLSTYTVNVVLAGRGGSLDAARQLLRAGAAVIRAGGFGVFCDASAAAHGSHDWLALADSNDDGGAYWAFVTTSGDDDHLYTTGMHVLGHRDAIMPRSGDDERDWMILNNFLGYSYLADEPLSDGDLIGDDDPGQPEFRVHQAPCSTFPPDTPFHNPYGLWRLEPLEEGDAA